MKKLLSPFQKFVQIESFSGILLFAAAIVAIIWANSPWADSYQQIWSFKLGFKSEIFELNKPLILWINDGLMAVFFFLIGLEIKRELLIGELNSFRKAAFPLFAAIGGMTIPVLIFLLLNNSPETLDGWGIPMATDIAFSLAILKLLGNRVPLSLKVFLTAFAIVDDLGAVLVIALFYSGNVGFTLLFIAIGLLVLLFYLSSRNFYSKYLTLGLGVIIWIFFLKAGIHPTIAGVLLAFTIPIRQKINFTRFKGELKSITERIGRLRSENDNEVILSNDQIEAIDNLEDWTEKVQSPLQHLEHQIHNWVAYFIIPLFALANAGVAISGAKNLDINLIFQLAICLVIGNAIGVTLLSYLGLKLGLTDLPKGIGFWQILGIAFLAGVGFTMSIFIANLAFADSSVLLDSAKIGILIGSLISGLIGYTILRIKSKPGTKSY